MKLFFSPGACSLVSHIALREAGADFELLRLDLAAGDQQKPDFLKINPHGRVPALALEDRAITENVAILNYLADRFGSEGSVPRGDPLESARCNELLGWFASTVHIAFAQIFRAARFAGDEAAQEAVRDSGKAALDRHFAEIENLCGSGWLVGDRFSGADSYALTFFRWGRRIGKPMDSYPAWRALAERVLERPAVQKALEAEGLEPESFLRG